MKGESEHDPALALFLLHDNHGSYCLPCITEGIISSIQKGSDILTLINVFTVAPENQQQLVDLLTEATEITMKGLPGFISANIHRSLDGKRVVNYAQWQSTSAFEAMQQNPEAAQHMKAAASLALFDPILCEVAEVITVEGQ